MKLPKFEDLYKKRNSCTVEAIHTFMSTVALNLHTARWCDQQHGYLFSSYGYHIMAEDVTYMCHQMKPYGYRVEVSHTVTDGSGGKHMVIIPII